MQESLQMPVQTFLERLLAGGYSQMYSKHFISMNILTNKMFLAEFKKIIKKAPKSAIDTLEVICSICMHIFHRFFLTLA